MKSNGFTADKNNQQKIIMTYRHSFLALFLLSGSALAETVYISDQIKIWSRTGHTNAYKVHYQLTPGTKFEVLQRNDESGFVEVRDEQGRTTWVDGKLLTSQPTAHQRLVEANREIERLKKDSAEEVRELTSRVNQMAPLEKVNQELQTRLAKVESEMEQAKHKAQLYEGGFNREFYFSSALVMLGGILVGWIMSRVGGKKRNSAWS